MKFNEKLQKLRKENKLSQEQLADMLDVSRQSVSKWESGQTYPEMDKLIAMCKIFKCSLDDLTNDDITDINITGKQKNNFTNIIDELLDIINRSINMFQKMEYKAIARLILEMIIVFIILLIFKAPFDYVYHLGKEIFINFGNVAGNILSSILNLILKISYFILFIIVFIYVYKIRYLDKYDKVEINPSEQSNNEDKKHDYSNEKVIYKNNNNPSLLFKVLGNIAMYFIKFITFCISIPFVISFIFLSAAFITSIILIFKGVIFIGIIIGIVSAILLNFLILKLIVYFLFNKSVNVKNSFLILIISLFGIGIAFGITIFDISNINYINEGPNNLETLTTSKEFKMNDDLIFNDYLSLNNSINYVVNDAYNDKVVVEAKYYSDYINISIFENDNEIIMTKDYTNNIFGKKFIDTFIENLSNKTVFDYSKLENAEVTIFSTKENIDKLKSNFKKRQEEIYRNDTDNMIDNYEKIIEDKNNQIDNLENENLILHDKVDEYEEKLQEYKDNLNNIIND